MTRNTTPPAAAARWPRHLMATLPGVEVAARIRVVGDRAIRYEDKAFTEYRFFMVDSTIFKVFTFQTVDGDMRSFLNQPGTVVITEEVAHKYFGRFPRTRKDLYWLTGHSPSPSVAWSNPSRLRSHWHFDFLCAKSTRTFDDEQNWLGNSWHTYVRLREGASAAEAEEAFDRHDKRTCHTTSFSRCSGLMRTASPGGDLPYRYVFQPLTDIHLYSHLDEELEPTGMITTVTMFGIVGVLVLLIACINIMNLQCRPFGAARKGSGDSQGARVAARTARAAVLERDLRSLLPCASGESRRVELVLPTFNSVTGKQLSLGMLGVPRPCRWIGAHGVAGDAAGRCCSGIRAFVHSTCEGAQRGGDPGNAGWDAQKHPGRYPVCRLNRTDGWNHRRLSPGPIHSDPGPRFRQGESPGCGQHLAARRPL